MSYPSRSERHAAERLLDAAAEVASLMPDRETVERAFAKVEPAMPGALDALYRANETYQDAQEKAGERALSKPRRPKKTKKLAKREREWAAIMRKVKVRSGGRCELFVGGNRCTTGG